MANSVIGIGMIGCGTVGTGVARVLAERSETFAERLGGPLRLRRVLVREVTKPRSAKGVSAAMLTNDPDAFFATEEMPILIEVSGGRGEISQYVRRALSSGKHVVTANKSLLAAEGPALYELAKSNGVSIAFEASCAGGIPIVTALQFGLAANRIEALYGILNGTCNYILTEMSRSHKSYDTALAEAQAKGFAEADPTLDVSGQDAAQKLAILASLAFGVQVAEEHVDIEGIHQLDLLDIRLSAELGYTIKLLAIAQYGKANGSGLSLRVHPCFIHSDQPLAKVDGPFNAVSVYGDALGHTMYLGRGAGQMPTASAVVSDLLNVAAGWYSLAFSRMDLGAAPPAMTIDPLELQSRFYLRMNALDMPGTMAKISQVLGDKGISISAMLQHESAAGQFLPVVIITHAAQQGAVRSALTQFETLAVTDGTPICIPIVDMPEE